MAAGLKTIIALSFVLAIGFLLVILSSALFHSYLTLLVVATYVLAPLPNWICGRCANPDDFMESAGSAVVDFGRFCTGFLVVMGVDICLWNPRQERQFYLDRDAKLHFLSLVHVPSIPLYLAAWPSLRVSSDNDVTAAWLSESLSWFESQETHDGEFEDMLRKQSEQGILLRIENDVVESDAQRDLTELLLYASVYEHDEIPSTLAASSLLGTASEPVESIQDVPGIFKVYALPLSSKIINQAAILANLATLPTKDPESPIPAYFLPHQWHQPQHPHTEHRKRPSMSALFNNAAKKRKKFTSRTGESVAQTMAGLRGPVSDSQLSPELMCEDRKQLSKPVGEITARQGLSRASSMASIANANSVRPQSRRGTLASEKRPSLQHVESTASFPDNIVIQESDGRFSSQNRAALSKTVMAGMRLYGLQQKKKSEKSQLTEDHTTIAHEPDAEDEYKAVYHQTYKAAAFAFRRQFDTRIIPQEALRDIVDRILDLFCSDDAGAVNFGNGDVSGFDVQSAKTHQVGQSIKSKT
ncbi:Vacuolar protein sorting-associated protein 55 [Lecanora helva]